MVGLEMALKKRWAQFGILKWKKETWLLAFEDLDLIRGCPANSRVVSPSRVEMHKQCTSRI